MRTGVVFPQTEIGDDPVLVRDYAQTVEGLGYTHLLVFDHVLGAGLARRPGWRGAYDSGDSFHELFVLLGYLAGLTERIELVTGVLMLPQRQTALVAKQAAEVDVLSGGRLRLGVGVGWNDVEYEALGKNFRDRGGGSRSRSRCCARCGPSRSSTSRAAGSAFRTPGSTRCRCSGRSRSGSAVRPNRCCGGSARWATAGSRRCLARRTVTRNTQKKRIADRRGRRA